MNEWLLTHTAFVHLCKPGGEERVTICGRVMTTFPDEIEPWTMKCQYCQMHEKRNGTTKHDR